MADPRVLAEEYLEQHKICQLFETLTAQLLFQKPDNPKKFLIRQLEGLKGSQEGPSSKTPLLNEQDFRTMFGMLDITKRGVVSKDQANASLKTIMGPTASFDAAGLTDVPEYLKEEVFVSAMMQALKVTYTYDFSNKGLLPWPGAIASA